MTGVSNRARADKLLLGPEDDVVIATVGHGPTGDAIRDGALLAIEQLNADGGLLGRKIRLHAETVELTPATQAFGLSDRSYIRARALSVANRVLDESRLIAVIGHETVEDALPAAIAYLGQGVPFIAPTISTTGLTLHGLKNIYATLPDNAEISAQTARLGFDIGLRRAVIVRDRSADGLEISLSYRSEAATLGMLIVEERSFSKGASPRDILAGLQGLRFDHLLIMTPEPFLVELVKYASTYGLNVTCVVPRLTSVSFIRSNVEKVLPRILVPVLRASDSPSPIQVKWDNDYFQRFGAHPLDVAMQGTDAVGLLAEGVRHVGDFDLTELGRVLHGELAYTGVGGRVSFRRNGRIYTRLLSYASIRKNERPRDDRNPFGNDVVYYKAGA